MPWSTGFFDNPIFHVTHEAQTAEDAQKLKAYETDHYRSATYIIRLEDGAKLKGVTFKWAGEIYGLTANTFDPRA